VEPLVGGQVVVFDAVLLAERLDALHVLVGVGVLVARVGMHDDEVVGGVLLAEFLVEGQFQEDRPAILPCAVAKHCKHALSIQGGSGNSLETTPLLSATCS